MSVIFRKRSTSRRVSRICESKRIMVIPDEGLIRHLEQIAQACRGFCGGNTKNISSANGVTFCSHGCASRPVFSNSPSGTESDRHTLIINAMRKPTVLPSLERGVLCPSLNPPVRQRKLIVLACISSWNATRPLAGAADDTCLNHRADACRHSHPMRGLRPHRDRRSRFSCF